MSTNSAPAKAGSNDGLGPLPEARWKLAGNGPLPYEDAYSADQVREYAKRENAELRKQLDRAINDADIAIEHARRVDAKEREALRSALSKLVQVYVRDGVALTPASEVGDAWKSAQRALLKA